jgi:AcrR family transcriptional regulator
MNGVRTKAGTTDRRAALLSVAAAEFASVGFERASLNAVLGRCGWSKSSFYHAFESKVALFDTVIAELGAELALALDPPGPDELAGDRFWPQLRELGTRLAETAQDPRHLQLGRMVYLPDAPRDESPALAGLLDGVADWLADAIAVGRRHGQVSDDLPPDLQADLTLSVLQALDRWAVGHLDELDAEGRADVLEHQYQALRRLLAP